MPCILSVCHYCAVGRGGGTSPSFPLKSSAAALTRTYSDSELDSPSLGPGVGGSWPGIGGVLYDSCFLPVCGLFAVVGRCENSDARGLVGLSVFVAGVEVNVSGASGARGLGLERPETGTGAPLAFKRSSVALRRASRASSSVVWVDTAFFLGEGGECEFGAFGGKE